MGEKEGEGGGKEVGSERIKRRRREREGGGRGEEGEGRRERGASERGASKKRRERGGDYLCVNSNSIQWQSLLLVGV